MFHTERTNLKSCFGLSIEEAMDLVRDFANTNGNGNGRSLLYELTGTQDVTELVTSNPFAIKLLEEKPHLLSVDALHMNNSAESIDLVFNNRFSIGNEIISRLNSAILDTYLPKLRRDELYLRSLSKNPRAVPFLTKHPELIHWPSLCENPEALDLLEANPQNITFSLFSRNTSPRAIAILRANFRRIEWNILSSNSSEEAVRLLLENVDKINWYNFSQNMCPLAIPLIARNLEKCNSYFLSANPHAIGILRENPTKIYWPSLCVTASTREQFDFIRENLYKVDWGSICRNRNPRAIEFLMEFPERIQWHYTLGNQDIFETKCHYNYEGIRSARHRLHEEFHAWAGHPSKMATKWVDWGFEGALCSEDEDEDDRL